MFALKVSRHFYSSLEKRVGRYGAATGVICKFAVARMTEGTVKSLPVVKRNAFEFSLRVGVSPLLKYLSLAKRSVDSLSRHTHFTKSPAEDKKEAK